jgi:hypothetical protein
VGELLDEWLQCVIQAINPWRSDRDIDRGSLWFTQITNQLQETSIGIVCITQENKNNPWILFETGALAKGLSSSRVCTFLIDLEPSDIRDPLAQFNHTKPNVDGVRSLVKTLNSTLEEKSLPDKILDQVFDTYWPQFEERFSAIIDETPQHQNVEIRTENDILTELLDITRGLDKRIRDVEYNNGTNKNIITHRNNSLKREPTLNKLESIVRDFIRQNMSRETTIRIVCAQHDVPEEVVGRIYDSNFNNIVIPIDK